MNYKGKVTSGIGMSLVYQGKPFVVYGPYFTHSVVKKGRSCEDCHKNEAVEKMKKGEQVPMLSAGPEIWGPLSLSDGRLLVRDHKQLKCVDVRNPAAAAAAAAGGAAASK